MHTHNLPFHAPFTYTHGMCETDALLSILFESPKMNTIITMEKLNALVDSGALDSFGLARLDPTDPWDIIDKLAHLGTTQHNLLLHEGEQYNILHADWLATKERAAGLGSQNRQLAKKANEAKGLEQRVRELEQERDQLSGHLNHTYLAINRLRDTIRAQQAEADSRIPLDQQQLRLEQRQAVEYAEEVGNFAMQNMSAALQKIKADTEFAEFMDPKLDDELWRVHEETCARNGLSSSMSSSGSGPAFL